jgi:raffinose/stachyose/melibiose transport system permease protein
MSTVLPTEQTVAARQQLPAPTNRRRRRFTAGRLLVALLLVTVAIVWFLPFILLVMTGIRTTQDFQRNGAVSFPSEFTFQNFADAWRTGDFATTYRNSALLAIVKVPLGVFVSALMAYALARLKVRFRGLVLFVVFIGLTIPIYIALVPLFATVRSMGLINNIFGLLGPYLAFGIPFEVLILYSFFRLLPNEIFEAARVDGAGPWRVFFQIVLPLSVPVLVTVFILDAVATWNELLMALTIISSDQNKTLPLGMLNFSGQFTTNYNGLAAAILIGILPILIAYALLQRYIVSGLTAGAVKG